MRPQGVLLRPQDVLQSGDRVARGNKVKCDGHSGEPIRCCGDLQRPPQPALPMCAASHVLAQQRRDMVPQRGAYCGKDSICPVTAPPSTMNSDPVE